MLPLAMLVRAGGALVAGSDRSFDQGNGAGKPEWLARRGVTLFAQDGSGPSGPPQVLVTSTAVESQIPDVVRALELGMAHVSRAQLLSSLFNAATNGVAVGGTSGKSTITAMIATILHGARRDPTVINGAVMADFRSPDTPFASYLTGNGPDFVAEVDESDGSIALYNPAIAVISNITIDHKPVEELKPLFAAYLSRASAVVANIDNQAVREVLADLPQRPVTTVSMTGLGADITARKAAEGVWMVAGEGDGAPDLPLTLKVFGEHNVSNALLAIALCGRLGVPRAQAAGLLADFRGVARRMEPVGTVHGISVYDDFGHNPDKIAASLAALRGRHGRILCFFQPHGYRPMELMKAEFTASFDEGLRDGDRVWMTDPVYYGGTVNRTPVVHEILAGIGPRASHLAFRADLPAVLAAEAREGDVVVIMGARDDTLPALAADVFAAIAGRQP
jgi:UDP-N-acetylmuramate--alanine ligase